LVESGFGALGERGNELVSQVLRVGFARAHGSLVESKSLDRKGEEEIDILHHASRSHHYYRVAGLAQHKNRGHRQVNEAERVEVLKCVLFQITSLGQLEELYVGLICPQVERLPLLGVL